MKKRQTRWKPGGGNNHTSRHESRISSRTETSVTLEHVLKDTLQITLQSYWHKKRLSRELTRGMNIHIAFDTSRPINGSTLYLPLYGRWMESGVEYKKKWLQRAGIERERSGRPRDFNPAITQRAGKIFSHRSLLPISEKNRMFPWWTIFEADASSRRIATSSQNKGLTVRVRKRAGSIPQDLSRQSRPVKILSSAGLGPKISPRFWLWLTVAS